MYTLLKATFFFFCLALSVFGLEFLKANRTFKYEGQETTCISGYTRSTQNGWMLEAWLHGGSGCRGSSSVEMTLRLTATDKKVESPLVKIARLEIHPADKPEDIEVCSVAVPFVLQQRKSLQALLLINAHTSKKISLGPNPGWVSEIKGAEKNYASFFQQKPGKYILKATAVLEDETKLVVDEIVIVFDNSGVAG